MQVSVITYAMIAISDLKFSIVDGSWSRIECRQPLSGIRPQLTLYKLHNRNRGDLNHSPVVTHPQGAEGSITIRHRSASFPRFAPEE